VQGKLGGIGADYEERVGCADSITPLTSCTLHTLLGVLAVKFQKVYHHSHSMPGFKRTSTYLTPGGSRKKKRKTTKRVVSVPRSVSTGTTILRRHTRARLTYSTREHLSGSIVPDANGFFQYNMNGIYDPEVALGGGQPRGFDQMAALYQEYKVVGCTAEVYFSAGGSGSSLRPYLCIRPSSADAPSNKAIFEGTDRVISTKVLRNSDNGGFSTMLRIKCDIMKWLGNQGVDNDSARAVVSQNPNDRAILYVGAMNAGNTSATADADLQIVLHYDVIFFNPQDPGSS